MKIMSGAWSIRALLAVALAGGWLASSPAGFAAGTPAAAAESTDVASAVKARLNKGQFKDVQASVDANGIVTLRGTVNLFEYKSDAEKRARNVKGVAAVRNEIEVGGPNLSDHELEQKLVEKLSYDRVGYGNVFNAISVRVRNGVVMLGGHARTDVDKDSAIALVSTYAGVKDVVADIEVDPTSIIDDQLRLQVARAIYGYPSLNRYAIDPVKPIRIAVQNGHVELYGEVDSQADKDTANIRANAVPGVFSVENHLQVAGQNPESPQK
ncbi:MAG TPA: BON domain-containing protein [Terracidiphilus sp.]|nr:BON domain-containing protein [Terracidiphilus sp.]